MPIKHKGDDFELVTTHVRQKLLEVKETYGLTTKTMAKIACYERVSWHRIMQSGMPNLTALYALSLEFGLGMDFWFPLRDANFEPKALPPRKPCVCHDASPLSLQILGSVKPLSAEAKGNVLKAIRKTFLSKQPAGP